jgi:adenosylcobyric acid synthase
MNPVLLKPETDTGAQVVVQGRRLGTLRAAAYGDMKASLQAAVLESFSRLQARYDVVLAEGAGSPAEINLRRGDIANMGFAAAADVPVVLVGDIDRGGVIAQIVGTRTVLADDDAGRIEGFIVNRFRGDPALFDEGYAGISARTGWRGYGVIPWFDEAWRLPAEDALDLGGGRGAGPLRVVCLRLSRIANFDDLDPLAQEPGVRLTMLGPGQAIPGDADLVIVPGSKSTRGDLAHLRGQGWDVDLIAHRRRGGRILGICGGFQMLGRRVADPAGVEGPAGEDEGLGLLDVETTMSPDKRLAEVRATHLASGRPFHGYEIHIGRTEGPDRSRPFAEVAGRPEGARSVDGRVVGTYLHGMFRDDGFRAAFLAELGAPAGSLRYGDTVERTLDALAAHLETHLDVDGLLALAR